MKVFTVFFAFSVFLFFVSCAPLQAIHSNNVARSSAEFIGPSLDQEEDFYIPSIHQRYIYEEPFSLDDERNGYIEYWLDFYSEGGKGEGSMIRYLERSSRYIDFMEDIFKEEGLPADLVYVSMAESGFWHSAKSTARPPAIGYWQFIPSTATQYGLRIDYYVDERRDFELSTRAAARFLRDLYNRFGNWYLSLAGYNCGPRCVEKAINKYESKDFWYLVQNKALPIETRNFVPRIIALRKIALKPWSYGFHRLNYQASLEFELVALEVSSSLSAIAKKLGVSHEELKSLNPQFKTDQIPVRGRTVYIRIPVYGAYDSV